MVVASVEAVGVERIRTASVPVIDLSWRRERERAAKLIVRACEEFGFFKVVNHGVSHDLVSSMEAEAMNFFSLPAREKQQAGPPNPLGYGARNIGFTGDIGDLEYLLLNTNPSFISQKALSICKTDPSKFCEVVNEYVGAMRELASEILEMLGEGLGLGDVHGLSKFIRDTENDSLLRFNHYTVIQQDEPYNNNNNNNNNNNPTSKSTTRNSKIGFGDHSDPQIITVLHSNDVPGLQILASSPDGPVWVPVPPDPTAFYVIVGDALRALTNGRLMSVRHRAMAISRSSSSRLSMIYFGGPPLHAQISPFPETVTPQAPRRYKSFT
ncbi:putative gibberellin 2-beta-dioxygenase [Dioscorea sansibarensis]